MALSGQVNAGEEALHTPASVATDIVDSVFAANDLDQDEALVVDELPAAGASIAATADADGDGAVRRSELRDRIAQDLSQIRAQYPQADIRAHAGRWLDSLLGRVDGRTFAARSAYEHLPTTLSASRLDARR